MNGGKMSREADYTIQGFLYQFNKTALAILTSQDGDTITVEGVIEDIDVSSNSSVTAIQCKYHEANESFSDSDLYKPLLQMLSHYASNQSENIHYLLFAYFPQDSCQDVFVDKGVLEKAMRSKNKKYVKYIEKIPSDINLDSFMDRFEFEIGPSYDDMTEQVCEKLMENGIDKDDIDTLSYPNAIQMVATLSIKHDSVERQLTKKQFLTKLKEIRKTAISRWTLSLKTRGKLLKARRDQLKTNMNVNTRQRYFVFDPTRIEDYEREIVLFISEFLAKYHVKPAHVFTPVVCLCASRCEINDIQHRLFAKGIISTDGYVGGRFEKEHFFREPFTRKESGGKVKRDFSLRILSFSDHGDVLNDRKCDDLFVIGDSNCDFLEMKDVNVERLDGVTIKELKFVLGVSNVYG